MKPYALWVTPEIVRTIKKKVNNLTLSNNLRCPVSRSGRDGIKVLSLQSKLETVLRYFLNVHEADDTMKSFTMV